MPISIMILQHAYLSVIQLFFGLDEGALMTRYLMQGACRDSRSSWLGAQQSSKDFVEIHAAKPSNTENASRQDLIFLSFM